MHPANEPLLIAGVGTLALELAEDLPELDAIIVPMGSGSLRCGARDRARALLPAGADHRRAGGARAGARAVAGASAAR